MVKLRLLRHIATFAYLVTIKNLNRKQYVSKQSDYFSLDIVNSYQTPMELFLCTQDSMEQHKSIDLYKNLCISSILLNKKKTHNEAFSKLQQKNIKMHYCNVIYIVV